MFKSNGFWCILQTDLLENFLVDNQLLCHYCKKLIGDPIGNEIVRFYKNKVHFWY